MLSCFVSRGTPLPLTDLGLVILAHRSTVLSVSGPKGNVNELGGERAGVFLGELFGLELGGCVFLFGRGLSGQAHVAAAACW